MAEPAFVLYPRQELFQSIVLRGRVSPTKVISHQKVTVFVALCLAVAQLLDAYLTYKGLSLHGTDAEGNPVIQQLCLTLGIGVGIITAKLFSLLCLTISCWYGMQYRWLSTALGILLVLHITFAIVPWSYLLLI